MEEKNDNFTNRGALWDSRDGEDGDWNGRINIEGTEYRIVAKQNPKYSRVSEPFNPRIPPILLYHIDHDY